MKRSLPCGSELETPLEDIQIKVLTFHEKMRWIAQLGEITGCFLGLDDERNILGCHFPKILVGATTPVVVMGEDTWPPHPPKPPVPPVAGGSTTEGANSEGTYTNGGYTDGADGETPRYFSLASDPMDVCEYFQKDVS